MAKYVYPAVFTEEEGGAYSINFPDLEGCYTCGDNLVDGLTMASDVLSLTLYHYKADKRPIPAPSDPKSMEIGPNEFINFVACDTEYYHKKFNSRAVKKTLTIPEWMNTEATALGINFSQLLQDAIAAKLNSQ